MTKGSKVTLYLHRKIKHTLVKPEHMRAALSVLQFCCLYHGSLSLSLSPQPVTAAGDSCLTFQQSSGICYSTKRELCCAKGLCKINGEIKSHPRVPAPLCASKSLSQHVWTHHMDICPCSAHTLIIKDLQTKHCPSSPMCNLAAVRGCFSGNRI